MQREDVERLAELLAKATPGEWYCGDGPSPYQHRISGRHAHIHEAICEVYTTSDAALIAAAINALRHLLRVYRAWLDAPEGEYRHDYIDNQLAVGVVRKEGDGAALFSNLSHGQRVRLIYTPEES